uniref:Uncharacterized protein n=1 Tax=Marmota marmota marmota TaxID=9994 RepID=A0A8C5YRH6_MARMA
DVAIALFGDPSALLCSLSSSCPPGVLLFQGQCLTCQLLHLPLPSLLPQGPPPISYCQAINLETEMGLLSILCCLHLAFLPLLNFLGGSD